MLARQVARASSGDGCKSKSSLRISGTPAFISARHEVCRALKACPAGEVDCEVAESSLQHSAAGDVSACNSAQVTWRASTLSLAQTSGSGLALGSLGTSGERHSHRASLTDCEKSSLLTARLTGLTNPGRPVPPLPVTGRSQSLAAQTISTPTLTGLSQSLSIQPVRTLHLNGDGRSLTVLETGDRPPPADPHRQPTPSASGTRSEEDSERAVPPESSRAQLRWRPSLTEARRAVSDERCLSRYCWAVWLSGAAPPRDLSRRPVIDAAATTGPIARRLRAIFRRVTPCS